VAVRLVETGWERELRDGLFISTGVWRLACPFIKQGVIERLLAGMTLRKLQVVTRFNLADFASPATDIGALRALVEAGGEVRGLRGLHAKVFVFGKRRAAVTSANLTSAGLDRNAEFGCVSDDREFVTACDDYFQTLWDRASVAVRLEQLDEWQAKVSRVLLGGGRPDLLADLPDYGATGSGLAPRGVVAGVRPEAESNRSDWTAESTQAHLKFMGTSNDRLSPDTEVRSQIIGSGCYYACCYPRTRRPRKEKAGDTIFLGRLTRSPDDTLIFGRAIALRQHDDGDDNATPEEIVARPWKATWPRYIRVHHAEFIAGRLANGISLETLMTTLAADSFVSTQENRRENRRDGGTRNTNPRSAKRHKPAMPLTTEAFTWLTEEFERAIAIHGSVPASDFEGQYWPKVDVA
jgi:hypothetical protein